MTNAPAAIQNIEQGTTKSVSCESHLYTTISLLRPECILQSRWLTQTSKRFSCWEVSSIQIDLQFPVFSSQTTYSLNYYGRGLHETITCIPLQTSRTVLRSFFQSFYYINKQIFIVLQFDRKKVTKKHPKCNTKIEFENKQKSDRRFLINQDLRILKGLHLSFLYRINSIKNSFKKDFDLYSKGYSPSIIKLSNIITMKNNKKILHQQYIYEGDYITLKHLNYYLCSESFQLQSLSLKNSRKYIIETIFVIQSIQDEQKQLPTNNPVMYGQKIYLRHLLTNKYLCYSINSNQEDIYLKVTKSKNCVFILKPLLRFQPEWGRNIVKGDEIKIQSPQHLSLYIEVGTKLQNQAQSILSLSRYESSSFCINRFNSLTKQKGQLSNIDIYQLLLVQNDMKLFVHLVSESFQKVRFMDSVNLYGSFIVFQVLNKQELTEEKTINYNQELLIRFFTYSLYLGFTQQKKVRLFDKANEQCIFILQHYEDVDLKELSVLKLKHKESGLYVSWQREDLVLQGSNIKNMMYIQKIEYTELKIAMVINNIYRELFNIFKQKNTLKFKNKSQMLIRQLMRVVYKSTLSSQSFFQLSSKIQLKIGPQQQNLLVQIGFLSLILNKIVDFLQIASRSGLEVKRFYHQAIINMMMVIIGICHNNQKNEQLLIKYIPNLFKHIFSVPHLIKVIMYLLSENIISQIQTYEVQIKNKTTRMVKILLEQIQNKRFWNPNEQLNIFKLLQKLLISKQNKKYLIHEYQIMKSFQSRLFQRLFYRTRVIDDEISVEIEGQFIQLSDIYQKKGKYNQQITIFNAQFDLLCTLFTHTSIKNMQQFQKIIPEEVSLNYIKSKMQTQDKKIFLEVIVEVYLCRFKPKVSKLVRINGEPLLNKESSDRDMLMKLKKIVFQNLTHILQNDLTDRYLYMYLRVICDLAKLQEIQDDQWQILSKLQIYLCQRYEIIKSSQQFEQLSKFVLDLYQQHESYKIKRCCLRIIKELHSQTIKKAKKLDNSSIQKIIENILQEYGQPSPCILNYQYISKVILTSVELNLSLLKKASQVMYYINKSQYRILQNLKQIVLIANQQQKLLNQLINLHYDLQQLLQQYSSSQKMMEDIGLTNRILKNIREINNYFFTTNKDGKHEMQPFMQNVIRQNGFFESIVNFLQNSQLTYKKNMNELLLSIVNYLSFYTYKNKKNFDQLLSNYNRLKWLFFKESFGQHKLIYILVFHQELSTNLKTQIVNAIIQSFRTSNAVNCYGVMALIKLSIDDGKRQKSTTSLIQKQLISDPSLVSKICKINEAFQQSQTQNQSNTYQQMLYYWFLMMKLFMTIFQFCKEAETLSIVLKQHLNMKILLTLLTSLTSFSTAQAEIASFMLKQQMISYFLKYYQTQLFTLSPQDQQYLWEFINSFTEILYKYEYKGEHKIAAIVGSEIFPLVTQTLRIKVNFKQNNLQPSIHIHYTLLAVFYPFLLNLANSVHSASSEQIEMLFYRCTYKIKGLLDMTSTLSDELKLLKDKYYNAVAALEQILKVKLKFEHQQIQALQQVQSKHKIFRNKRLDTLLINIQAAKKTSATFNQQIYSAILIILFSPKIKEMLKNAPKKIQSLTEVHHLQLLHDNILQLFRQNKITYDKALRYLYIFLHQHSKINLFTSKYDSLKYKEIVFHLLNFDKTQVTKEFLAIFFHYSNYLTDIIIKSDHLLKTHVMTHLMKQGIKKRNKIVDSGTQLMQIMKSALQEQKLLYQNLDILGKIQKYQQSNCILNCEQVPLSPSIQQILQYKINYYALTLSSNKKQISHIMSIVMQTIKSYTKFIKSYSMYYVPTELYTKLKLCFSLVKVLIACQSETTIKLLIDNMYYNEFNNLLLLDDSVETCLAMIKSTPLDIIDKLQKSVLKNKLGVVCKTYLKSAQLYGDSITYGWGNFPLLGMKPHYGELKSRIVSILKELKTIDTNQFRQFLLHINQDILLDNIKIIYKKYFEIYNVYNIRAFDSSLLSFRQKHFKEIAQSICFENGIDLTSLLMYMQQITGNTTLERKYIKYCEHKKKQNLERITKIFVKNKDTQQQTNKILEFFFTKMGRVEIINENKLYSVDFIIYPDCIINVQRNRDLLQSINFVSTQLKIQSLKENSYRFSTLFAVYLQYAKEYCDIRVLKYMDKYLIVLKIVSLALIILSNIVELTRSSVSQPEDTFHSHQLFAIIRFINILVELAYFIIYIFKTIPSILGRIKYKQLKDPQPQKQQNSKLLVVKQLFKDFYFIYCIVVLILMFLVFVDRSIIAILVIDILIQIPQMGFIFKSFWRALPQILFSMIAFLFFGYYFAIIAFLVSYAYPGYQWADYCKNIGACYNIIDFFAYRIYGGFPGYIYKLQSKKDRIVNFNIFDVFSDLYLLFIFFIFKAVINSIVVNHMSKIQKEQLSRKQNMCFNCLICGLPELTFNKSSTCSFKIHTSSQHNLYNYLFYYYYLNKKQPINRNLWERRVILDRDYSWFPHGYAKGFIEMQNNTTTITN